MIEPDPGTAGHATAGGDVHTALDAGRAAESNFSMIQSHDRIMDRAINGLGRVSQ